MTTFSTDAFTVKRSTWSVLPVALHDAGRLAFPDCKSPRSIPDDKWKKLIIAYKTWHHIFCSDGLGYFLSLKDFPMERQQQYLNDIALSIAKE
jgi:hypothetical protein